MVNKDWVKDTARELEEADGWGKESANTAEAIEAVIVRHSPFKPNVAYMPVPRCETCAHWAHYPHHLPSIGICESLGMRVGTDFGCVEWKEK